MKRTRLAALAGFATLATALAVDAGARTWGRESAALLDGQVAAYFARATPLAEPFYNSQIVLYALLAAACLFAAGRLLWAVGRGLCLGGRALRGGRRVALGARRLPEELESI